MARCWRGARGRRVRRWHVGQLPSTIAHGFALDLGIGRAFSNGLGVSVELSPQRFEYGTLATIGLLVGYQPR